ncbi:hypothetical protein [Pseudoxanthomonas winnipegensis]|nr:hypothetical protein [Pseudoxanthomonas winnipegensis]
MAIRTKIRTTGAEWAAMAVVFCAGAVTGAVGLLAFLTWGR